MSVDDEVTVLRGEIAQLREAALDLVTEVQTTLLSKDAILVGFPLQKIGRLLALLDPKRFT
ncbi:hypothetical protein [Sphingomonas sp.]|uniref:hypothetical protein n=1 Tax=Sphingomonas sp. TaxID=28214 RepID=UPI000DB47268|nr:hypothetical protein [Sphingomonas sp.]PZU10283.1 MAG: hypothetical protein DI605_06810 [Sphingomonas sp.]